MDIWMETIYNACGSVPN